MDDVTPETLWRSVNTIQPSFIRTESDEATYNLHIMIRYELEKSMVEGDIEVDEIPDAMGCNVRGISGYQTSKSYYWYPTRHTLVHGGNRLFSHIHPPNLLCCSIAKSS